MTTPMPSYNADWLRSLPLSMRSQLLAKLTPEEKETLVTSFDFWARANQHEPDGAWSKWLNLGGRGSGKTWVGAHMVRRWAERGVRRMLLAGPTPADARDAMVEGASGILAVSRKDFRPTYQPSKRLLTWPNGATALVRSGHDPDGFRGPNVEKMWLDELAAWQYVNESYDNAMLALRIGERPQVVITTTPRPLALIKALLTDPTCVVTRSTTYQNRANLSETFFKEIITKYEGTRVGRQELDAELLDKLPGAFWSPALIDADRLAKDTELLAGRDYGRVVIGVDPAVTSSENADETGIIGVATGIGPRWKGHAFVFRDVSGRLAAGDWPRKVVDAYHALRADRIVAEVNNGGDLVEASIRVVDPNVSYRGVHASKGKRARAEPVLGLYEQHRVHHVGTFRELEDQMCSFVADERLEPSEQASLRALGLAASPDRVDALVWAMHDAMHLSGPRAFIA